VGDRYTIAGAGLAGSLLAVSLAKAGHEVAVYEKRPDPRKTGVAGGRSINLALSTRGIHALGEVGVADEVLRDAIPMPGRMIHSPTGGLAFQPYARDDSYAINSVSRGGLNLTLVEAAERCEGVTVRFGQRCTDVDLDGGGVAFEDVETGERTEVRDSVIVGADGAFSAVRAAMQRRDRFSFSQDYLEHGYKELTIPPAADGGFAMAPNALHIWPRGTFMMIALPNPDRTFTCTLFWPFSGFEALKTDDEVRRFFEETFPDAVPLMPTLVEDYRANPTSSLLTVRCRPWHVEDRVVLIGDACHAVVPFYGQGMNAAFEDVTILSETLREFPDDRERAFREYEERHRVHVNALADLALANFVEMRDHTGSWLFRARKRWDNRLGKWIPGYVPLYTMISFSRIPYADAVARARRQTGIVQSVAAFLLVIVLLVLLVLVLR
jgi:kynurenine 3-monooxygenase